MYKKNNAEIVATYENGIVYKNRLWFTDIHTNELFVYDIENDTSWVFCKFAEENEEGNRLFGTILRVDNTLYVIPFNARNMYKVNIDNACVEKVELYDLVSEQTDIEDGNLASLSAHYHDGVIYMIGARVPQIIAYHCCSHLIECYDIESEIVSMTPSDTGFARKTLLWNSSIYIPLCGKNIVAKFDILTKSVLAFQVGDTDCRYSGIAYDGEYFWLAPRSNNPIVRWDFQNNNYELINKYPEQYIPNGFADVIAIKEKVYFIPMGANMLLGVNGFDCKVSKAFKFNNISGMSQCYDKGKLYLFSLQTAILYIVDVAKELVEERSIVLHEKCTEFYRRKLSYTYELLSKEISYNGLPIAEDYKLALRDFQKYVEKSSEKKKYNTIKSVGCDIYYSV